MGEGKGVFVWWAGERRVVSVQGWSKMNPKEGGS